MFQRHLLITAAILMATMGTTLAQATPQSIALWPAAPPGKAASPGAEGISAKGSITRVSQARLVVYRPTQPNGMAALVIAGGGYAHIEAGKESTPTCRWLQSSGVTAFELIYRLPEDGWAATAPFQDGQRAMRIVRARAAEFGVDAQRIGVIGFSAGGHLAGMTAVRFDAQLYPAVDAADAVSARPDFAALIYPVLSMLPPFDQTRSRREIVGLNPSQEESEAYSVERQVRQQAPPTFLAQARDDAISMVDNSLMMFDALRAAQVPAEMHIFQAGGHGWGMGRPGSETQAWPELFARWAQLNGFWPPASESR